MRAITLRGSSGETVEVEVLYSAFLTITESVDENATAAQRKAAQRRAQVACFEKPDELRMLIAVLEAAAKDLET